MLVMSGALCTPTRHPWSIADILRALDHKLDPRWQEFGTHLNVEYSSINSIDSEQRGIPRSCMLHLVGRWLSHDTGTGNLPRTWETVLNAVREAGFKNLAMELAEKRGVTLTQQWLSQVDPLRVMCARIMCTYNGLWMVAVSHLTAHAHVSCPIHMSQVAEMPTLVRKTPDDSPHW